VNRHLARKLPRKKRDDDQNRHPCRNRDARSTQDGRVLSLTEVNTSGHADPRTKAKTSREAQRQPTDVEGPDQIFRMPKQAVRKLERRVDRITPKSDACHAGREQVRGTSRCSDDLAESLAEPPECLIFAQYGTRLRTFVSFSFIETADPLYERNTPSTLQPERQTLFRDNVILETPEEATTRADPPPPRRNCGPARVVVRITMRATTCRAENRSWREYPPAMRSTGRLTCAYRRLIAWVLAVFTLSPTPSIGLSMKAIPGKNRFNCC